MSKELTDAYRGKKLKKGWYWVKFNCFANTYPSFYEKGYFWDDGKVEDVVSPCDYEDMAHLETKNEWQAERIKELEQEVKTLTNNYKLLEDKQASDIIHGQALVDEFGDFEALYEELQNLRFLLKECDDCVRCLRSFGVSDCNGNKLNELSTRINAEIGKVRSNDKA